MAAAGVVAGAALLAPKPARAVSPAIVFTPQQGRTVIPGDTGDIKTLNYALALEALEADLYQQAIQRLTDGGRNGVNKLIPGLGLSRSEPDVTYVTQFAQVEANHRNFLDQTLQSLGNLSIIGTGANGILRTAAFDFGIESMSRQQVLEFLYTVELTGTQAYLGAIKSFSSKTYLSAAAGIQGTEARHTAVIAIVFNLLGFTPRKDTAPLKGQTTTILGTANTAGIDGTLLPDDVLAAVSQYIVFPTQG